jgi:hypothetical protein
VHLVGLYLLLSEMSYSFVDFFSVALRLNAGHGLLIHEVFQITHNDAPQSLGLLWTSDQLVAETSTWQHTTLTTDKHLCPCGIRTHDLSRRADTDLRLRPCGYWDRFNCVLQYFYRDFSRDGTFFCGLHYAHWLQYTEFIFEAAFPNDEGEENGLQRDGVVLLIGASDRSTGR